ncbi:UNVERIFIED_CONTAM: hypothetical protein DV101_08380, partial [Bifidobacterium animalis]|nr:hypothetical protein [Bifidobacterium animalis]
MHEVDVRKTGLKGEDVDKGIKEAGRLWDRGGEKLIDNRDIDEDIDRVMSGHRRRSRGMEL